MDATQQQAAPAAQDTSSAVAPQSVPPVAPTAEPETGSAAGAAEAAAETEVAKVEHEIGALRAELDAWFERHFSGLVLPLKDAAARAHAELKSILGL